MKRREFIRLGGGAAAWPLAALAQQPGMPIVGFLNTLGQNDRPNLPAAFRLGLSETGHVDGRNVTIEYDIVSRAWLVLNNERLAEPLRNPLTNETRGDVAWAAGREADDDVHRPRRIGLRAS